MSDTGLTRKDFLRQEALMRAREVAQLGRVTAETAEDVVAIAEKFHAFLNPAD
jgi:hypothetical protein